MLAPAARARTMPAFWKARMRRLEVWVAAILLRPPTAAMAAIVGIAAFCLVGVLFLSAMKAAQDLYHDAGEAYAWGQQFLGGYGRHPPLTGWLAGVWYSVLPAQNWAPYALSRLLTFVTLIAMLLIARRATDHRRASLSCSR